MFGDIWQAVSTARGKVVLGSEPVTFRYVAADNSLSWDLNPSGEVILLKEKGLRGRVIRASRFETTRPTPLWFGFESHER